MVGPVTHSAPGVFQMTAADGTKVDFTITEKSTCLYDITFGASTPGATVQAGLEVDANKIKTVTYSAGCQADRPDGWTDYTINIAGARQHRPAAPRPDGKLAETSADLNAIDLD